MDAIEHYPDPGANMLRRAVSDFTGLPVEMIIAGNGAVEIIYMLCKLFQPLKAIIPAPTFCEYEIAVQVNHGLISDLLLNEENGFILDKNELFKHWNNSDILFICNPNNPTGVLTPRGDLIDIIENAKKSGKVVIVDEAFLDFVADREKYSVIDLIPVYGNLFVLYSLTKFYAIPGLRLGIGLGNPEIIKKLNELRDPWNVNCFAQLAGIASLSDKTYFDSTVEYVSKEKDRLFNRINSIDGFKPFKPSANYILINVEKSGYSAVEICGILGGQGILVRDCGSYKNLRPCFIRVAVKKQEENQRLVQALQQLGRK